MGHFNSRFAGVMAVSGALVVSVTAVEAATVGSGASLYPNLLAGATTDHGGVGAPYQVFRPISEAIDESVDGYGYNDATIVTDFSQDPLKNGTTYMEWSPTSPVMAQTFLTVASVDHPSFSGASPYRLSTSDGSGFVNVPGHYYANPVQSSQFVVSNTETPRTVSALRVTFDQGVVGSGAGEGLAYFVMGEVIALPDKLVRAPIAAAVASDTLGAQYLPTNASDNRANTGWATNSGSGQTLTLTLAAPSTLSAIWITGIDPRLENFDLTFQNSALETVATVENVVFSDPNSALLKLNALAPYVQYITLTTNNVQVHYIGEIIPLAIPEPGALGVVALAGIGLRGRRSRRQSHR